MSGECDNLVNRRLSWWPRAILTVSFLGLTVAMAGSRSAVPVVLGRYSAGFFGYQLVNLAIIALLVCPIRCQTARPLGALLAAGSTFVAPMNDAVGRLPGLVVMLPALRLLAGLALVAHEFDRFRVERRPNRRAFAGLGAALLVLSAFDIGLWVAARTKPDYDENREGFRDDYDLKRVTPNDIVLVGDSFVWGDGVARNEKFGDVLERLYAREGRRVRVFSLGVRAAGPDQYVEALAQVPEGREGGVVICSFYPNDIAPRPQSHSPVLVRVQRVSWQLAQSSLSFHALHDLLGRIETPGIAYYHRLRVNDYRRDDATFPARWAALTAALDRFARLARRHSATAPLLLIIPLMMDYHDYPLARMHEDLAAAARGLGYDVLDLLPPFRTALGDGTRYRASPNDIHCDARVHALIAEQLKEHLDAQPATARLGTLPGSR